MKILFVHNYLATFTKIDLEILCQEHEVREICVRRSSFGALLQDNLRLLRAVQWADLVFAWFGGYHALAPFLLGRLLRRKCIVVASGYDVAIMPEIDYGNMRPGPKKWIGQWVFRLANRVLAVSEFTRSEAIRNAGVAPSKTLVIHHGVDTQCFKPGPPGVRKPQVLTVASVAQDTLRTKGLRTYIAAAAALPDVPFIIVGPQKAGTVESLKAAAPSNVHFVGPQYAAELTAIMQQSTVYAQLSAYESFGMAVVEAMLCGCIPVVTARGALPEIVGHSGLIVPYDDPQIAAQAIATALIMPSAASEMAREYAATSFPLERRRTALLAALSREMYPAGTLQ